MSDRTHLTPDDGTGDINPQHYQHALKRVAQEARDVDDFALHAQALGLIDHLNAPPHVRDQLHNRADAQLQRIQGGGQA